MISALTTSVAATATYWLAEYNIANYTTDPLIHVDYLNNAYISISDGSTSALVKINSLGVIVWQKIISPGFIKSIVVDTSQNVYLAISTGIFSIVKLTSAGVSSWQKNLAIGITGIEANSISYDYINNNLIVAGKADYRLILISISTLGVLVWQKQLDYTSSNNVVAPISVGLDSNSNIHLVASSSASLGNPLIKLDSSGNLIWKRTFLNNISGYSKTPLSSVVTRNGETLILYNDTTNLYIYGIFNLLKLDINGNILWDIILADNIPISSYVNSGSIALDSFENIYISINNGTSYTTIHKLTNMGTPVWLRKFGESNFNTSISFGYLIPLDSSISVGSDNSVYVLVMGNNNTPYVLKINADGSSTGNYAWHNYAVLTNPTSTNTYDTAIYLDSSTYSTPTYTLGTPTYTVTTPTNLLGRVSVPFLAGTYWAISQDYETVLALPNLTSKGVSIDSSNNVYQLLSDNGGSNNILQKNNSSGVFQWARKITPAVGDYLFVKASATNASGDTIIVGSVGIGTTSKSAIIKYNTSGAVQWQFKFGPGTAGDTFDAVNITTAGVIYVAGTRAGALITVAFTSAGAISWQRVLTGPIYARGIGFDSSSNVYVLADDGGTIFSAFIVKYTSTGTLSLQRTLTDDVSGYAVIGKSLSVNAAGDCYALATYYNTTTADPASTLIFKYNTSGVIQWQFGLTYDGTNSPGAIGRSTSLDSLGNLYVGGSISPTGGGAFISKFNTAGVGQWHRATTASTGYENPYISGDTVFINANSTGNFIYVQQTYNPIYTDYYELLLLKINNAGTTIGEYSKIKYAATTITSTAAGLTSATSTYVGSTPTNTTAVNTAVSSTLASPISIQFNLA